MENMNVRDKIQSRYKSPKMFPKTLKNPQKHILNPQKC